jgi:hypothetical protein
MIKKTFLLFAIFLGSVWSLQAQEELWELPPAQSKYFSGKFIRDWYEYELLIDMIQQSTNPLKTLMLKANLLVKLKTAEMHEYMAIKGADSATDKDVPYSDERKDSIRLRHSEILKELKAAERFAE